MQVNLFKFTDFLVSVSIPGFPSLDKNLQPIDQFSGKWCPIIDSNSLAPAVQTLDRGIHGINHYPVDKQYDKQLHYPVDRELSTFWTTGAWFLEPILELRWLNTVLAVCECMSFAKSWQEKGCSSQAETWQVKNILIKDCDWQVKFDVFVVSMATWMIEYNLKISLLFSSHKIRSLDFPINLHTAYCN